MPYCISKVKLDPLGQAIAAVWGRLEGGVDRQLVDARVADSAEVADQLRQGKLVWATFPTPKGLVVGGLCRVSRRADGGPSFDIVPETSAGRTLRDMQQF